MIFPCPGSPTTEKLLPALLLADPILNQFNAAHGIPLGPYRGALLATFAFLLAATLCAATTFAGFIGSSPDPGRLAAAPRRCADHCDAAASVGGFGALLE